MWAQLMTALGYERFGAQGGDWGAHVSIQLAYTRPDLVIAAHLNFANIVVGPDDSAPFTAEEQDFLTARRRWRESEGGYQAIQSTKPQTLGYGLTDSPAGLAAWIAEKFRSWSDCGGVIEKAIPLDTLLTNISIYWLTANIASSLRIYKENLALSHVFAPGDRVRPPLGFARFPKEIFHPPRAYLERVFDVRQWTEMPRGGHFAALEQPALLAEDIRKFFRPFRSEPG
jgi:pimeloyl-ACP methyl ester carboxylesterase